MDKQTGTLKIVTDRTCGGFADGRLAFEADVSRDPSDATMMYEIVAQSR